jgi:hypothetical protein
VLGCDDAGYRRWLASLLDRGIIAAPDPAVVEAKLDAARDRLGRAEQREVKPGSTAERLAEQARANVAALAEIARQEGPPPAAVRRGPGRPRKSAEAQP